MSLPPLFSPRGRPQTRGTIQTVLASPRAVEERRQVEAERKRELIAMAAIKSGVNEQVGWMPTPREEVQRPFTVQTSEVTPRAPMRRGRMFPRDFPAGVSAPVPLREMTAVVDQLDRHIRNTQRVVLGYPYGLWGPPLVQEAQPQADVTDAVPAAQAATTAAAEEDPDSPGRTLNDECWRLTNAMSIYEALRPPRDGRMQPVRLIRSSWVLRRAREMRIAKREALACASDREFYWYRVSLARMPRRQELPEEAFIDPIELPHLTPKGFVGDHRIAVFAVSYCW